MRVLMIPSPSATHFLPMVPLAWAVRAAGHELLVAAQPDVLGVARQAGLNAVRVGDRAGIDDAMLELHRPGQRPLEWMGPWTAEMLSVFPPVWRRHSENVLPRYTEFARAYRPDLIVADVMECNSLAVGGALGIPVAHFRYGVDPLSVPVREAARKALGGLCGGLGLDRLPDPAITLDPCPAALQLPGLAPGVPVRYVPYNGSGEMPGWLRDELPRDGAGRRVAVSMGSRTLSLGGVPLVRGVLHAFAGMADVEAVATVEEEYRAELGPLPENVRLVDPLPLRLLLGSCDAVVHHGGTGTGMASTSYGLPQLVLPQLADAFAYGERLAAAGAGVTLDDVARQNDPAHLRKALEAVLSDTAHAAAARELREAMADMPAPTAVVTELERLCRTGLNGSAG